MSRMPSRSPHTFPRSARILSRSDFDHVFKAGVRSSDGNMTLLMAEGKYPWARLGISISRRFGNAVRRNRAKRLIREAFRMLRSDLSPGTDWVIIPRPQSRMPSLSEFTDSMKYLTSKLMRKRGAGASTSGSRSRPSE